MEKIKFHLEQYNDSYYVLWNDTEGEDCPTDNEIFEFFIENCGLEEEESSTIDIVDKGDYAVASHYGYDNCVILRDE